jgi:hypothetical protein
MFSRAGSTAIGAGSLIQRGYGFSSYCARTAADTAPFSSLSDAISAASRFSSLRSSICRRVSEAIGLPSTGR